MERAIISSPKFLSANSLPIATGALGRNGGPRLRKRKVSRLQTHRN